MPYDVFLDGVQLPVTPEKITLKIKNQNKTADLIDGREINILKSAGLSEITFDAVLPQFSRPYARYPDGFKAADYYLSILEKLKTGMKPFQFIVSRVLPNGKLLFDTNIKVSLEHYQMTEDAAEGFDIIAAINLKSFSDYCTKTVNIDSGGEATVEETRPAESAPEPKTYTVVKGDCLWNIAKKYLGNGERYTEIFNLNRDKIKNPNLIYPGQILILP